MNSPATARWLLFGILTGACISAAPLFGQSLRVMPVAGAPGETVIFEIWWEAPPATTASALQFEAVVPAQVIEDDGAGALAGRAAEEVGKTLTCAARKAYLYSCLLAGGHTPMPNGQVAMLGFKIKKDTPPGTSYFRIVNAEAVTMDLNKVMLKDAEAAIVVSGPSVVPSQTGAGETRRHDAPNVERASPAYALVERYLQRLNDARSTLDYEEARELLARAQEALKAAQLASAKASPVPAQPKPIAAVAAAEESKSAAAHNQRGRELLNQGKYAEAIEELNEAIRLKPDFAQALNARGFTYYMHKDFANARKDLDEAIRLNPNYRNAYQNRSLVRKAAGDAQGSAEDQNRAKEPAH